METNNNIPSQEALAEAQEAVARGESCPLCQAAWDYDLLEGETLEHGTGCPLR